MHIENTAETDWTAVAQRQIGLQWHTEHASVLAAIHAAAAVHAAASGAKRRRVAQPQQRHHFVQPLRIRQVQVAALRASGWVGGWTKLVAWQSLWRTVWSAGGSGQQAHSLH